MSCVPLRIASPFLGAEHQWLQPGFAQRDERRHDLAVELHLTAPDQREGEMRERREVARSANRPLRRNDRVDAQPQEVQEPVRHGGPRAREPERQRVHAQHQHRPHDIARQRLAHADGVTDEQVLLEPGGVGPVDRAVRERTEPGGQAVDDRAFVDELIDHRA
jgi:hypothetical protein